jgi:hypothetical protein
MEIPEGADTRPVRFFAVLVDGEYAGPIVFAQSVEMEGLLAALESNPTIIPITPEQAKGARPGWIWDGEHFNAPEGV